MITSGTARITAKIARSRYLSHAGPTPRAANIPSGIDSATHPIAPSHAIEIERHVSNSARGSRSQLGSANISTR